MDLLKALKSVYENQNLCCGPVSVPSDAIIWDPTKGFVWMKCGCHPTLFTPSIMFDNWIVGVRTGE